MMPEICNKNNEKNSNIKNYLGHYFLLMSK